MPGMEKTSLAVYDERQSLDFQVKGQSSMQCISHYESPLGAITLAADEKGLTGLWFDGEKYFWKYAGSRV